jgi:oxygen-independent coproporphyrinogen-3 oxidase
MRKIQLQRRIEPWPIYWIAFERKSLSLKLMSGLYIHIPFCRQACIYCNFHFKTGTSQVDALVDAICREIEVRKSECTEPVETIYFGGGTPSFVPAEAIDRIIKTIHKYYPIEKITELTLEANPDDINETQLLAWKAAGVTRLSIGVQSFYDSDLKWMNRAHNGQEAETCIKLAIDNGFEVSIDLIFGLPESKEEQWRFNLIKANALGVHHLSCYGLTLEENTAWKKLIERGKYAPANDQLTATHFEWTMEFLSRYGWQHYEISNYCQPGFMAKHNTSYWQQKPYLGFGPSAHSFNGTERQWNVADNAAYTDAIEKGTLPAEKEVLTKENKINEYIMTGMRTKWGIDLLALAKMGGRNAAFNEQLEKHLNNKMVEQEGQVIRLTNKGKVYADAIASDFFVS